MQKTAHFRVNNESILVFSAIEGPHFSTAAEAVGRRLSKTPQPLPRADHEGLQPNAVYITASARDMSSLPEIKPAIEVVSLAAVRDRTNTDFLNHVSRYMDASPA